MGMAGGRPKVSTMVGRALRLRCPWCAGRRTFIRRWVGHYPRCRTCGIRWRREDGFELGPMTLNIIVTFVVLIATMTVLLLATLPDVPVAPVVAVLVGISVVVPVLCYPFCYTLWLAGDLAARPPTAAELDEARGELGAQPGHVATPNA